MAQLFFFILIFITVVFEVAADIFFKQWSIDNRYSLLGIGMVLYTIASGFWAYSLKHEDLSKGIAIFTVLNLIAGVLVGVLYFKDILSLTNIFGIIFGIVSIILLSI